MSRWRRGIAGWCIAAIGGCGRPAPALRVAMTDSLFEAGAALYRTLQYDSARTVWTVGLGRARGSGDSAGQARFSTELGRANWRLSSLAEARTHFERAIGLDTVLGLGDSLLARSLNGLGLVAKDEGRYREAIGYFERSATRAKAAGDPAGVASATGNLGLPLQELGELSRARENFRIMRQAGRDLRDQKIEANGLANEASVDIWEGDPIAAVARLDSARIMYRSIGYLTGEQNALGQLGTAFELTGELDRAFAALDSSLDLARRQGLVEEEAEVQRLIGGLHAEVGDWRRAIRFFQAADSLYRTAGVESGRAAALRGAADGYAALDNLSRARSDAEAALALHASAGERLEQLDDLAALAEIAAAAGTDPSGRLDSADALAERIGTRAARLTAGLARARAADRRRDSRAVLSAVARLVPDLAVVGAGWELDALAARAFDRLGNLDSAAAAGHRAVAAVERTRERLGSDLLRSTLAAERAAVYGDLVLVLLKQGRPDESFAVADAARSRGLLEHLAAARREGEGLELARGDALLRRIDRLVRRLRETESSRNRERSVALDPNAESLVRELVATRSEYEVLAARVERSNGRATSLLGGSPPRLDDVRAALGDDELLLEYLVTDDRIILFVVSHAGIRALQQTTDPRTLSRQIELLRDLWGRSAGQWRQGLPAAEALHHLLIEPVREAGLLGPSVKHLIIVPHGILGQLPFASVRDRRSGRFLVEDQSVSYLPTASSLPSLRRESGHRAASLAAGEAFAPFPRDLPATAQEVASFRSVLPGGHQYLGTAATEAAFRVALGGLTPVHLASHGTLNVRNPMFSRVELASNGRSGGPRDDGRLEVHEIIGLTVRSPLVFFSGCETGAGRAWTDDPIRGTADHTLAQATLAAGAGNVVATLWRIDDVGAAEFALRFYERLRQESVNEALASAQRILAKDSRYANPYYWAGYVLSGEGRFGGGQAEHAGVADTGRNRPKTAKGQSVVPQKGVQVP